jgi:hypothetical protein
MSYMGKGYRMVIYIYLESMERRSSSSRYKVVRRILVKIIRNEANG